MKSICPSILAILLCATGSFAANQPPVLQPIGNKSTQAGSTLEFAVQAVDGDGGVLGYDAEIARNLIPLQSHFVPFGMCINHLSVANQISRCQTRGFTGLSPNTWDLNTLRAFADHPDVKNGSFKIHSAYWWTSFDVNLDAAALNGLDARLDVLAGMNASVWLTLDRNGGVTESMLATGAERIRTISEHCQAKGVPLVIYPHGGTLMEDAEEAVAMLQRLNIPSLKIMIHLCHEIMAGNGARVPEIVADVAQHLAFASISGSTVAVNKSDNWASQIKPLDQGDYNYVPYIQALADVGFTGPMALHTYNLGDPGATPLPTDHMTRSMRIWRMLVAPTE